MIFRFGSNFSRLVVVSATTVSVSCRFDRSRCEGDGGSKNVATGDNKARILHVKKDLDKLYSDYCKAHNIPGMVYGIVYDGELVVSSALGVRAPSATTTATTTNTTTDVTSIADVPVAVDLNTRFRIASMSKSFTSMAILHLRDRGLLNLDDPVENHIPELKLRRRNGSKSGGNEGAGGQQYGDINMTSPVLTIRHLLSMQGGFPQDDPWGDRLLSQSNDDFRTFLSEGITSANEVGVEYEYSNMGYAMLGLIITNVSKMSYQKYIRDNILTPLDMLDTTYEYTDVNPEKFAPGFRFEDGIWKPEPILNDGAYGAMGGLVTTVADFSKYVAFHQSASPTSKLNSGTNCIGPVNQASLKEMHFPSTFVSLYPHEMLPDNSNYNPRVSAYGYGLSWNRDARDVVYIRHAGGLPGYGSEFRFLPGYNLGIISFANRTYAPMTTANNNAMELLLGKKVISRQPEVASPQKFHNDIFLSVRAKQLFEVLSSNFAPPPTPPDVQSLNGVGVEEGGLAIFADNFFLDKPKRLWEQETKEVLDKVRPVASVTPIKMINKLRGSFMIKGSKGDSVSVFLTMNPEKTPKIQEVRIKYDGFDKEN